MPLELTIVSPGGVILREKVDFCEVPAESGIEGILPGHINFISNIKNGVLKYKKGGAVSEIPLGNGFVESSNDLVNILIYDIDIKH